MGYRKQKSYQSAPELYMDGLEVTRGVCGRKGFILSRHDLLIHETSPVQDSLGSNETQPARSRKPFQSKPQKSFILKKQQSDAVSLMKGAYQDFD
jgi:hypothetical protein